MQVVTDAPPRGARRAGFMESERMTVLELPPSARLGAIARSIERAMRTGQRGEVEGAARAFLSAAAEFYQVPKCEIRVLAARPLRVRENWTSELFGDYQRETRLVRVWMKTAVRKEITSFGTFLSTLCHEFCHHLDCARFGFHDSWHTRGFYERAAALYHHARGTPAKRIFWAPASRGRWRIDWPRTNRGSSGDSKGRRGG